MYTNMPTGTLLLTIKEMSELCKERNRSRHYKVIKGSNQPKLLPVLGKNICPKRRTSNGSLLEKQHSIDKMENIMNVLHITDKGQMMNTIEKYYIYRETKMNNQINDKLTVQPNVIFETIFRHETHRGLQTAHDPQANPQYQS
jgi:hypothetical protein